MKKNITINLFGTLYAIDEDAYNLLESYLDSMKSYFRNKEGGEEIADDIEHRVAELLWEKKEEGSEAVSIDMVKDIIAKIGNPEDIANEEGSENSHKNYTAGEKSDFSKRAGEFVEEAVKGTGNVFNKFSSEMKGKRLYRNPKDKIVGGVCSGLAEYFMSSDPLWWRLGFVILTLIPFFPSHFMFSNIFIPALYVILLIIVPVASTPADRLRMKGQEVSPENLKDQVIIESEIAETKENDSHVETKPKASGCLRGLFFFFMFILLLPLFVTLWSLLAALIGVVFTVFGATSVITSTLGDPWFVNIVSGGSVFVWLVLCSGIFVVGIPVYAIIHALNSKSTPFSGGKITFLIILWLMNAALFAVSLIFGILRIESFYPGIF